MNSGRYGKILSGLRPINIILAQSFIYHIEWHIPGEEVKKKYNIALTLKSEGIVSVFSILQT